MHVYSPDIGYRTNHRINTCFILGESQMMTVITSIDGAENSKSQSRSGYTREQNKVHNLIHAQCTLENNTRYIILSMLRVP